MMPADIAAPVHMRRLGVVWFLTPVILVSLWLVVAPHHGGIHHHLSTGVAAGR